jgi:hypothetical protein
MLIGRNLHNATQLNLEGWPASEPELLTWWIPRVARYNVESSKYDGTSRVAPTASNERLGMRLNRSAQSGTTSVIPSLLRARPVNLVLNPRAHPGSFNGPRGDDDDEKVQCHHRAGCRGLPWPCPWPSGLSYAGEMSR